MIAGYSMTIAGDAHTLIPIAGVVFPPLLDEPEPVPFSAAWSPHCRSAAVKNMLHLANRMSRSRRSG